MGQGILPNSLTLDAPSRCSANFCAVADAGPEKFDVHAGVAIYSELLVIFTVASGRSSGCRFSAQTVMRPHALVFRPVGAAPDYSHKQIAPCCRMNDLEDHREVWNQSIYEQLHRIAEKALKHEAPGHSLQPTLLVNDAYLRLLDQRNVTPEDRSAVMAAGANIIRRLLVDYARKRKRLKRGGENGRGNPLHFSIGDHANQIDVLELNDAMEVFAKERPRAAQVVELKFFGGLTGEVIAEQLGVSIRTVKNDWRLAKAWLYRELGADHDEIDARYESGMGAVVMAEKTTVTYKTQALLCSLCCLLVQTVLHGRSLMIRNHRQFQLAAATVAGFLFWLLAGFASGETWTDQSGKYQVDAKFVGVEGRSVVLRKIDGSTVEVPIDRLSAESRARAKRMYEMSKSGASVRGDAPQAAPTMSATATASSSHLSPNGLKLNFTPPDPPSVAPMPAFPENASLKETFDFVSGQVLSGHPEVLWYALPEEVRTTFDSEEMRIASLQSRKAEQATTDQMVGVVLKALEVLVTKKQFVLNSPFMTQVPPPAMPMIQQGYDPAVGTIFEVAMTLASATEEMEKMTITEILDHARTTNRRSRPIASETGATRHDRRIFERRHHRANKRHNGHDQYTK